ncbi:MAG: MBL fold metallo-hydrolase [Burkholderiales bacterium]|nr:MBL fold metallo-hydrolase [Burkholderiales bacterium]
MRLAIGGVSLDRVVESEMPTLDPFEIYPDARAADIESNLSWLAPRFYDPRSRLLILAFQGFVLRTRGKTVLVDTCVGDCKPRRRALFNDQRWGWLDRLDAAGFAPEDIDVVVCTHFHVDHVGWNTRLVDGRWVPTFPKARYLFAQAEWDYWWSEQGRPARERAGDYVLDSVLPVVEAGLVDFIEMDRAITDEVRCLPAAGHTPGLLCIDIRSGGERAILASDVLHTPLQCRFPHWSTRSCADPDHSRRTRLAFLEAWADSGVLVLPAHFPSPSAGTIERDRDAYRFRYAGEADAF